MRSAAFLHKYFPADLSVDEKRHSGLARVTITQPGEDVDVGGDMTVIGTSAGGEVITVLRGTILLDPSFNAGGDTVRLPDDAAYFAVRLVGSTAILTGLGISVTIPVGTAGLQVSFNDISRTLRYDPASASVKLGDQTVTSTLANVVPAGGVPTLVGTEGPKVINGTEGNDVIDSLGGADRINGGAGNDVIRGGTGGDDLDGSFGNDQLFGDPGDDRIYDNEGASADLDGGTGNDWLSIANQSGTSFQLFGGDGDDFIEVEVGSTGTCVADAGAGQDRVVLDSNGITISVTLGSDRDQLVLADLALASPKFGPNVVADFQAGQFGDTVEFLRALSGSAIGWDQGSNPFSSGYCRLIERDGSVVLQFDRDGARSTLFGDRDAILLTGIKLSALTSVNFEGFDPTPTASEKPYDLDTAAPLHAPLLMMADHLAFA